MVPSKFLINTLGFWGLASTYSVTSDALFYFYIYALFENKLTNLISEVEEFCSM